MDLKVIGVGMYKAFLNILAGSIVITCNAHAQRNFPEYGSPECASCYDQQYQCYQQNNINCTKNAVPCIQDNCTKTKINR